MAKAQGTGAQPAGQPAVPPEGGEPQGAELSAEPTKQPVTMDVLEQALLKVNNDLRASLGRELKALKDGLQPAAPDKPEETPTDRTYKERLAVLEERDSKAQRKALRLSIREALQKAGADPSLAELAVPAILEQEGSRFSVRENQLGDYEAGYQEGSVSDWAKVFMQGELGKRLALGAAAPSLNLPAGSQGQGARRRVPASQVKSLTNEELNSGRIEIVEG